MNETNTNSENSLNTLTDARAAFEKERAEYQREQNRFLEITKETKRLMAVAEALESEAEACDAQWKNLAEAEHVDQKKVNAEIERGIQARQKAQTVRITAEARGKLARLSILAMAAARFELTSIATMINATDLELHLEKVMADEAFRTAARAAYSICETQCMAAVRAVERPTAPVDMRDVNGNAWRKFSTLLQRIIKADGLPAVDISASIPTAVPGEIVAVTLGGLNRLRTSGGAMPTPNGYQREFQLKQA